MTLPSPNSPNTSGYATFVEEDPRIVLLDSDENVQAAPKLKRSEDIDAVRGIIMIIMALDHASLFSGYRIANERWNNQTSQIPEENWPTILYFLTRFITHLSQTGFFFLMGIGMVLYWHSRTQLGVDRKQIVQHFVVRGAILIAMTFVTETIVFNFSWWYEGAQGLVVDLGILSSLGFSMIVCSFLLLLEEFMNRRPPCYFRLVEVDWGTIMLATVALTIALITNFVIHALNPNSTAYVNVLLSYLISGGYVAKHLNVYDPVLPWVTVCLVGILFGKLFVIWRDKPLPLYKSLFWTVVALWAVFILLRVLGLAGVTKFGSFRLPQHSNAAEYFNAFFTLSKYPPSIAYLCLFLGGNMLTLWLVHKTKFVACTSISHPALVFGKSALFFFVAHLYLYFALGYIFQRNKHNLDALWVYPIWVTGLVLLYPICAAYGKFKSKTDPSSLWRLF